MTQRKEDAAQAQAKDKEPSAGQHAHEHAHVHADGSVCHHNQSHNHSHNHNHHNEDDSEQQQQQLLATLARLSMVQQAEQQRRQESQAARLHGKPQEDYAFWDTQPVPKLHETVVEQGALEPDIPLDQVPRDQVKLPSSFEWVELDIGNDAQVLELQEFLADHYLEDTAATFRMIYSVELLRWALTPPGWLPSWHPCVRVKATQKLVGFISAIPCQVQVYQETKKMVEINFLCVHKKLRSKRLAPVLIREITRRVHLQGIFQAFFTAGTMLPKPISDCQYFHRQLNPKKLIETGFSYLKRNMTLTRTIKLYKLPENPVTPGFRAARVQDVEQIYQLHKAYMKKFSFYPRFDAKEAEHYFTSRENALQVYVVESPETGAITDFIGFFTIANQVLDHSVHTSIQSAFLWYYAARTPEALESLVNDALIMAKKTGHDVFNCLAAMDNLAFLDACKFGPGDASLKFYLYNYKCPEVPGNQQAFLII